MKARFSLRLTIKLIALVLYVMLLHDFGTGRIFHMLAGSAVCLLTVIGLALDHKYMRAMRHRYKDCTLSTANAVLLSTETLIALEMVLMPVTGVINALLFTDSALGMTVYGLHLALAILLPLTMAVRISIQFVQWCKRKGNEKKQNR